MKKNGKQSQGSKGQGQPSGGTTSARFSFRGRSPSPKQTLSSEQNRSKRTKTGENETMDTDNLFVSPSEPAGTSTSTAGQNISPIQKNTEQQTPEKDQPSVPIGQPSSTTLNTPVQPQGQDDQNQDEQMINNDQDNQNIQFSATATQIGRAHV